MRTRSRVPADETKRAFGQLRWVIAGRVFEGIVADPIDGVKAVERECANRAVLEAVRDEIYALLVDEQRVRLDDEFYLAVVDAIVAHTKPLFPEQRRGDVVHVLESLLIDVRRFVDVEDLAIEVANVEKVFALQRRFDARKYIVEIFLE